MINIYEGPVNLYQQEMLRARAECYICEDSPAQSLFQATAASRKGGELMERWRVGLGLRYQVELPWGDAAGSSRLKVGACQDHESNLGRLRGL